MRRSSMLILALAIGASFAPVTAQAAATPEARFVELINIERTERGLSPLRSRNDLAAIAERHSERMRQDADIYHNSDLGDEIPGSWQSAGENVGVGFDVDGLHAAFMASRGHRVNILRAGFDTIGLGVVIDPSGDVYVTEVFVDNGNAPTPPAPKPAPKPKPPVVKPSPPSDDSGSRAPATAREPEAAPFKVASRTRVDRGNVVRLLIRIVSTS